LFDENGKLIGITTFKIRNTEGVNFAHLAEHVIGLISISSRINDGTSPTTEVKAAMKLAAEKAALRSYFSSNSEANAWLEDMSHRLETKIPDSEFRLDFLKAVHYESIRAGLDPQLVLGLIEVLSGFKKYTVSPKGEVGFMRVHPKWVRAIGQPDQNLFHLRVNLRYGCTILRYYLDTENGNLAQALARYDGSVKNLSFPNKVIKTWKTKWLYQSPENSASLNPQ
jgi:soluble lytic murein transglycosylase-like protein